MSISDAVNKVSQFASANQASILTGIGVTGTVTTAYLTGRASFKAADLLQHQQNMTGMASEHPDYVEPDLREKAQLVWKLYIPPVLAGTGTVIAIVAANRVSSKQAAALAAAYGISEKAFAEYKEKVVEKIGEAKETAVRDEIAQDKVNNNPPSKKNEIIIIGGGEVLFMDSLSGRYFMSTVEQVRKAVNDVNFAIVNHAQASLSEFYDHLGLSATEYSDEVGWNLNNSPFDIQLSTTLTPDQQPCIVLGLTVPPGPNYGSLY